MLDRKTTRPPGAVAPDGKPRIALMGEFSSGKSKLSNLLIGERPLPEKVTATRLSPVWISAGERAAFRVLLNGDIHPVAIDDVAQVPLEETRMIRLFLEADILDLCHLIDMPGISDPNMLYKTSESLIDDIDMVIWCTHATQAWRQTEAAVWATIPAHIRDRSILLVTRIDKIDSSTDRDRLMARVRRETAGQFDKCFAISLAEAVEAGEFDQEIWRSSGAEAFASYLIERLMDTDLCSAGADVPSVSVIRNLAATDAAPSAACLPRPDVSDVSPVMPRRVVAHGEQRRERLRRDDTLPMQCNP